ncbi:hypothetical protein BCR32DRAFT_246132 [Anaeromyces robustus]|uniref:Uncharacterized protein n=1 Tax=Anaeromyces robustus TaxID=1754192 RepID=A0A1Y1X255_9FUNG|nr:hypothetical protein BCR32DRAFT_246132 [Anaeromyces robustus]|eukprot:ORX79745.1 hypothetical protein BCR32DRAFT_246132 [Anaeromyces robustus]
MDSINNSVIDAFLAQEIEKLLQNEISIPQFISEYEAYEILSLLYGESDSGNTTRNNQNLIQRVNQTRIQENSTLLILDQRLRNNININDPDFLEESVRQLMNEPIDPNNQFSVSTSNLIQNEVVNRDLNRSYYSLGSSSDSSSNVSSQTSLNHSIEINISELPVNDIDINSNTEADQEQQQNEEEEEERRNENIESNINSSYGELNRDNQNISSMINFFANSPYSWNSPTMGISSGNEVPTNRFIHSYRNQFEMDFHCYFDENGDLREEPLQVEDLNERRVGAGYNSSLQIPLIDYRGRPNVYYESPSMRGSNSGLSMEMAQFCGNTSEVIATILGAESREVRHNLIYSLIRGVLAVRWQQHQNMEEFGRYNEGREEEEGRRVMYNDNNSYGSGEDGDIEEDENSENPISRNNAVRASSSTRYRVNELINR